MVLEGIELLSTAGGARQLGSGAWRCFVAVRPTGWTVPRPPRSFPPLTSVSVIVGGVGVEDRQLGAWHALTLFLVVADVVPPVSFAGVAFKWRQPIPA